MKNIPQKRSTRFKFTTTITSMCLCVWGGGPIKIIKYTNRKRRLHNPPKWSIFKISNCSHKEAKNFPCVGVFVFLWFTYFISLTQINVFRPHTDCSHQVHSTHGNKLTTTAPNNCRRLWKRVAIDCVYNRWAQRRHRRHKMCPRKHHVWHCVAVAAVNACRQWWAQHRWTDRPRIQNILTI